MDKIITEAALQESISLLKMKQAKEGKFLKEEFHTTYERLKPVNIVKNIFRQPVASPGLRANIIDKTVDVVLVFLTNRLLRNTKNSIIKRTIGTALVLGIKTILSRHPGIIKKAGIGIMNSINNIITKRKREYTYNSRM